MIRDYSAPMSIFDAKSHIWVRTQLHVSVVMGGGTVQLFNNNHDQLQVAGMLMLHMAEVAAHPAATAEAVTSYFWGLLDTFAEAWKAEPTVIGSLRLCGVMQ